MTFPITISALFLIIALMVAANSGKLVPIATIVRPIINSEIPKISAILSAFTTAYLEPKISAARPRERNKMIKILH